MHGLVRQLRYSVSRRGVSLGGRCDVAPAWSRVCGVAGYALPGAGKPLNEARNVAWATLTAIMIRESAYTGRKLKWNDFIRSNDRLGPSDYAMSDVPEIARWGGNAPAPGKA